MKKILSTIILVSIVLMVSSTVYGANIQIKVDGMTISSDVTPESKNNRIMVPLRVISENLGATVEWSNSKVTLISNHKQIDLTVNSNMAEVDGQQLKLDVKTYVKQGRIFVPIRFVTETFGGTVDYSNFTVSIHTDPLRINDFTIAALQQEYLMTLGSTVQQVVGNVYIKALHKAFVENIGEQVDAPAHYSWDFNLDTPISYYKNAQYDFINNKGDVILRYDVYTRNEVTSDDLIADEYPKVLLYDLIQDKWFLFNEDANQSVTELIFKASNSGFVTLK